MEIRIGDKFKRIEGNGWIPAGTIVTIVSKDPDTDDLYNTDYEFLPGRFWRSSTDNFYSLYELVERTPVNESDQFLMELYKGG